MRLGYSIAAHLIVSPIAQIGQFGNSAQFVYIYLRLDNLKTDSCDESKG